MNNEFTASDLKDILTKRFGVDKVQYGVRIITKFSMVWEPSPRSTMILAGASQLCNIFKLFMKLTKLRGLTGGLVQWPHYIRRRRRLTMYYYALMSQQSNWSATEGRAFKRRHPESWSIGISIHWKSMCGEDYRNREPPSLWSSLGS